MNKGIISRGLQSNKYGAQLHIQFINITVYSY